MRQVLKGGLWGAAPGAVLLATVAILYSFDVITSDQSQIGFVGVPLLFFGLLIGMLAGAAAAGNTPTVLVWMGIGLVVGIALGAIVERAFVGSWLVIPPLSILGGGVFGAWKRDHHSPPPSAIPH